MLIVYPLCAAEVALVIALIRDEVRYERGMREEMGRLGL
jgi:hypothetical protein